MSERMRWRIAHLLDKLPGQCWTDLVMWAIDGPAACRQRGENPLPWRPMTDLCRQDADGNAEGCYCGKLRQPAVSLRASDTADLMILGQLGDDDQWRRWRTLVPHIRRNANAENQATEGEHVRGSGSVGSVRGSGHVGSVGDSGSVGSVRDSGSVEYVGDSGRVGSVRGSGRVEKATGAAAIQGVYDHATVTAGPHVAVHVYSAAATVTGGVLIDLTKLDELPPDEWCEHHGIDAARLQAELEHITAHPAEWNQGVWAQKTACGTACCLAGGAVLRAGIPLKWKIDGSAEYTERGVEIRLEAQRLFGLSSSDAERLFSGGNSLGRLWSIAAKVTHGAVKIPATVTVGAEDDADYGDEDD